MKNTVSKTKLPLWVTPALQGIAFWLGYKKQYFNNYHLTEGAIVGELTQLISFSLSKEEVLRCEVMYNEINPLHNGGQRLDLSILEKDSNICRYAIEVKRYEAGIKLIEKDLIKLFELKRSDEGIRCFLLVVSQNEFPEFLVTTSGNSKRINLVEEYGLDAYVRRTCKASSSFKVSNNANFASIIEVL